MNATEAACECFVNERLGTAFEDKPYRINGTEREIEYWFRSRDGHHVTVVQVQLPTYETGVRRGSYSGQQMGPMVPCPKRYSSTSCYPVSGDDALLWGHAVWVIPAAVSIVVLTKTLVLAGILQAVFSGVLNLAPASILRKDGLRVTISLSFLAILVTCHLFGLLFALPVAVALFLFSLWVRFVGHASEGTKRTLFVITVVLSALFLAQHVVHLPIRVYLAQAQMRILANIAAIFWATAMFSATLELLLRRKEVTQQGQFT